MVPERHEDVAGITTDDEILRLRQEAEPVSREVTLHEPAVLLRLEHLQARLEWTLKARVDPR